MQVPDSWQRNCVSGSHTVVAEMGERWHTHEVQFSPQIQTSHWKINLKRRSNGNKTEIWKSKRRESLTCTHAAPGSELRQAEASGWRASDGGFPPETPSGGRCPKEVAGGP